MNTEININESNVVKELDKNKYYVVEIDVANIFDGQSIETRLEILKSNVERLQKLFKDVNMLFVPVENGVPFVKFSELTSVEAVEAFNILMKEINKNI